MTFSTTSKFWNSDAENKFEDLLLQYSRTSKTLSIWNLMRETRTVFSEICFREWNSVKKVANVLGNFTVSGVERKQY